MNTNINTDANMYVYVLTKYFLILPSLIILWAFFKMFFDYESREVSNIFENDFLPERIKKKNPQNIYLML